MWWNENQVGVGSLVLMTVMMVLFWGGLITLGVWLVHSTSRHPHDSQSRDDLFPSGRTGR